MNLISVNSLEMQFFVYKYDLNKTNDGYDMFLILSFEMYIDYGTQLSNTVRFVFNFPCPPSAMQYISKRGTKCKF